MPVFCSDPQVLQQRQEAADRAKAGAQRAVEALKAYMAELLAPGGAAGAHALMEPLGCGGGAGGGAGGLCGGVLGPMPAGCAMMSLAGLGLGLGGGSAWGDCGGGGPFGSLYDLDGPATDNTLLQLEPWAAVGPEMILVHD
jgi:hypothetical protein